MGCVLAMPVRDDSGSSSSEDEEWDEAVDAVEAQDRYYGEDEEGSSTEDDLSDDSTWAMLRRATTCSSACRLPACLPACLPVSASHYAMPCRLVALGCDPLRRA